jgi:hypothetical protein
VSSGQTPGPQAEQFKTFVPEFLDRLESITDDYLDDFNEHLAFDYLVAELFDSTNPEQFKLTDGTNDGGIDFFVQAGSNYAIYQCKCPEVDTLTSVDRPPTFDKSPVQELLQAVRFVLDDSSTFSYKPEVLRLRTDFHRDLQGEPDDTTLRAALAVMGELTPAAHDLFVAESRKLSPDGVTLELITWNDVRTKLRSVKAPGDASVKFSMHVDDPDNELLRHRDYCYALIPGGDLYDAWRAHEWSLFDWNVRLQLPRSPINKRIVASLEKAKTRKIFHHLNNGILITCRNYKIHDGTITLEGAQIVNGCQTVCAIRDAFESLSPEEQAEFRSQVRVQVKVIKAVHSDLIDLLVVTTNDQNPMNARNLKSNTAEQKSIQHQFRSLTPAWFYQRKDGEFESLKTTGERVSWFRKSDYAVTNVPGRQTHRVLDSKDVAKNWYAWIGFSDACAKGGVDFFDDGDDSAYPTIFKSRPSDEYWQKFLSNAFFSPDPDLFTADVPTASQFLLASACAAHVRQTRVGWKQNRDQAIARGLASGSLKADPSTGRSASTEREIDEFLAQDDRYRITIMTNNMLDVLVELYAFVLCRKYGALSPSVSKQLLSVADVSDYVRHGFKRQSDDSLGHRDVFQTVGAFLEYCMTQYYYANRAEIQAAARLKALFFQRKTVHKIRQQVASLDSSLQEWAAEWKPLGRSPRDMLPDL